MTYIFGIITGRPVLAAYLAAVLALLSLGESRAASRVLSPRVKTLQTIAGNDFISPPVLTMGDDEVITISFDEMSHDSHRLVYHIDHCEADWTVSNDLFESDFLEGFNDNTIDDYEFSLNTTHLYTHYEFEIPNDKCRLKLSGNYRVTVYDEDEDNEKLLEAEFMLLKPTMTLWMDVTTNTDIDANKTHQQLSFSLDYGGQRIINATEQIYTIVTINDRDDIKRINVKPDRQTTEGLEWAHNRDLIFEGGNEYHKFEMLDLSHPTMGVETIDWDGEHYNVYPFVAKPRSNYLYDEDVNGAYFIRNSDNVEIEYTCDYAYVHYKVEMPPLVGNDLIIQGRWTNEADKSQYKGIYSFEDNAYNFTILQKQGYYSYQFLGLRSDGSTFIPPTEGNFYQTENRYQIYVYFKPVGGRTWQLAAFRQLEFQ